MNTWMVRAGAGGRLFSHFKDDSVIGLGWYELNDLDILKISERKTLQGLVLERTDLRPQSAMMTASQLIRFIHEFKQSDRVVTYDTSARKYLCGTIVSEAIRTPELKSVYILVRSDGSMKLTEMIYRTRPETRLGQSQRSLL